MKYKIKGQATIYLLILSVGMFLFLAACSKEEKADYYQPEGPMTASLDQTHVTVGTPLKIDFTGMADSVVFYSGKNGEKYEYRNRTEVEGAQPTLSFATSRQWGNQENTLRLLISRDFDGEEHSPEAIEAATWEDITDLAILDETNSNTPSGIIDLESFISTDPIVIAFKYVGQGGTTQRTWTITNFFVRTEHPDGTIDELANIQTADWVVVPFLNPDPTRNWVPENTRLRLSGGNADFPDNESWAVSTPLYLNRVNPDEGRVIKTKYQFMLKNHWFAYHEPGAYTAAVVGKSEQEEVVYEFDIEVEE